MAIPNYSLFIFQIHFMPCVVNLCILACCSYASLVSGWHTTLSQAGRYVLLNSSSCHMVHRGIKHKWAELPKWEGPLPRVLIIGHAISMLDQDFLNDEIEKSDLKAQITFGDISLTQAYTKALGVSDNIAEIKFEEFPYINADDIREHIEDPTAFRPDILVVQRGGSGPAETGL